MGQTNKQLKRIGIVAGGPIERLVNLADYEIDYWIGCDRGALYLLNNNINPNLAIGDFDSVDEEEFKVIKSATENIQIHPVEKDLTDLELAINAALELNAENLFLFGVTGGRKDHELNSIFLLERLIDLDLKVKIVDQQNMISMYHPGQYQIIHSELYPKVSFIPLTKQVSGLSLMHFYYPLTNQTINRGESLTISNHLIDQTGHFSFDSGILIVIKSSEQSD
ncbi:thiamine diphosphokinase [Amphibacillus indicireducens]|uniref:Thiamine diphosphokinase n=1 Tax=Amphibacillus indicireducens TaxID=1076330 RepID=A0ABP7VC77_9BACI